MEHMLAPGLVIAMSRRKAIAGRVVLLIQDNAQGAFGLLLNSPSNVRASELFQSLGMTWNGFATTTLWSGGPTDPRQGWVLHEPTDVAPAGRDTREIVPGISLSTSTERLRALGERPPTRIRVILGSHSWGPGELLRALRKDLWRCTSIVDPELVFATPADRMWDLALRLVADAPPPKKRWFR
jgi:putative AlgH/UPF0301 family transcriptional regulator